MYLCVFVCVCVCVCVPVRVCSCVCVSQVHLFSKEDFQGSEAVLEDSAEALQPGFSVASCRVLAGR